MGGLREAPFDANWCAVAALDDGERATQGLRRKHRRHGKVCVDVSSRKSRAGKETDDNVRGVDVEVRTLSHSAKASLEAAAGDEPFV
jgi:hypothetical protein